MELADEMGVSFQAVSNWERGATMPDISKLPELAQKLGVSVDELLGDEKEAEAIKKLVKGEETEISGEELVDIAPIMKPTQIKKEVERNKQKISMQDIIALAPFMDSEGLKEIAETLLEQGGILEGNMQDIIALAPFMDSEDLREIAETLDRKSVV